MHKLPKREQMERTCLKASEIGFEPTPAPHHQTIKAQLFSVGLFFWEILNVYADLRRLPCDFSAIKIRNSLPFLIKITTFSLSVLSDPRDFFTRPHSIKSTTYAGVVCKLKLVGGSDMRIKCCLTRLMPLPIPSVFSNSGMSLKAD